MAHQLKPKFEFAGSYGYDKDEVDTLIDKKDSEISMLKAALFDKNVSATNYFDKYMALEVRASNLEKMLQEERDFSIQLCNRNHMLCNSWEKERADWEKEKTALTAEIDRWKTARDECENQFHDKVDEVSEWVDKYIAEHMKLNNIRNCLTKIRETIINFISKRS